MKLIQLTKKQMIILGFLMIYVIGTLLSFLYLQSQVDTLKITNHQLKVPDNNSLVYEVNGTWKTWPEQLLTYNTLDQFPFVDSSEVDYSTLGYATHALDLSLPSPGLYGLIVSDIDYAACIYVDNTLLECIGMPGTSSNEVTPRVKEEVLYFYSDTSNVRLWVTTSNFVHSKEGSTPLNLVIGQATPISHFYSLTIAFAYTLTGIFLMTSIYHFCLFILNSKRSPLIYFSLCCLLLCLFNKQIVMMFFPNYDWNIAIRLEYIVPPILVLTFLKFLQLTFPHYFSLKWIRGFIISNLLFMTIVLITPTLIFTKLLFIQQINYVLVYLYVIYTLYKNIKDHISVKISFYSLLVFFIVVVNDILWYRHLPAIPPIAGQFYTTPLGMIIFILSYSVMISIEYSENEREMQHLEFITKDLVLKNTQLEVTFKKIQNYYKFSHMNLEHP